MMRPIPLLCLLVALPASVPAIELVANGTFEDDLSPAWQVETVGSSATVNRSTAYDGDPDYEVMAEKLTGNGHARLGQTIVIPSTDLDFSVSAKLEASTTPGPWAAAGVALNYEDCFDNVLGTTMIVWFTTDCPWYNNDTFHMILAPNTDWNSYDLNVADELLNLAGVDPLSIHQIRISVFAQVGGDC